MNEKTVIIFSLVDGNLVRIEANNALTPETLVELMDYLEVHAKALERQRTRQGAPREEAKET